MQYAAQWDAHKHFEVGIYDKHCFLNVFNGIFVAQTNKSLTVIYSSASHDISGQEEECVRHPSSG